jgi:diguanylate cyclase (GGDEF)-like protein
MFAEQVETRLRAPSKGDLLPVVLFLDLDDFKIVNDTLGHAAGDLLLISVGERIRECIRGLDLAARLGGDEFAILLDDTPSLELASTVARRLIDALSVSFPLVGDDVVIGASIGIAMARSGDQSADELLRNADVAMYTAKALGKRRFAVFEPTMHTAIVARHELSAELARGISRDELVVYHQPIVDLATGRPYGLEALVRWRHPTRGLVLPDDFIGLSEETGSILALGRQVMERAEREVGALNRRFEPAQQLSLSVNVSPIQLQQPDFLDEVEAVLAETGFEPERLILEITETAMFRDTQATIRKLQALRGLGVRIAMDDFGTGYSSLSYLRRFPVDILKIAKDLIGPAQGDSGEWAFAAAIVALGRTLDLRVVAEGIEHPGQLERLRELGCEFGQGYLFARPGPIEGLASVLGLTGSNQAPASGALGATPANVPGRGSPSVAGA